MENTAYYRAGMERVGLPLRGNGHPIIPVMVGEAALSQKIARRMLDLGIYVIGFFYPVVPQGKARIRTQISAAHSRNDLDHLLEAWEKVKLEFGLSG
jgi:glycine C-acetyltransferase